MSSAWGTAAGVLAILLWSTTIAVARSVAEVVGPLTGAAAVYAVSGTLSLARLALDRRGRRAGLDGVYLGVCGGLFVAYTACLYLGVGLAGSRPQVLEVGLLNYLWPAATILLSLPLLGVRASWGLWPGTGLAVAGVALVLTQGAPVSWAALAANLAACPTAYALGLAAALTWGLYSNLTRRLGGGSRTLGVFWFLPATALLAGLAAAVVDEPGAWTRRAAAEAAVLGTVTFGAYAAWDAAMRYGHVARVAAASYLTPLLSTLVSVAYLGVPATPRLWLGCALLVSGSVLSWRAVRAPADAATAA